MTSRRKEIWDGLKAEAENRSNPPGPEFLVRWDAAMEPVYGLLKAFESERNRQPFTASAPCPVCESGIVTYTYQAPLVGNMSCDTCEYVKLNL
jgi:hypothetical protein